MSAFRAACAAAILAIGGCSNVVSTPIASSVQLEHLGDSLPTGDVSYSFRFDPQSEDCPRTLTDLAVLNERAEAIQVRVTGGTAMQAEPSQFEVASGERQNFGLQYNCNKNNSFNEELTITVNAQAAVLDRLKLQITGVAQ